MTATCNFTSTFSINFGYWKLVMKHANGDHMTTGHCDGGKRVLVAKHPNGNQVTMRCCDNLGGLKMDVVRSK